MTFRLRDGWREIRARYFGLVTLVDRAVGGIMRALEESGQAEDTIVVYTSEHGEMLGDHAILHKTMMYEEAMRVPFLMHVPWLSAGAAARPGSYRPGRRGAHPPRSPRPGDTPRGSRARAGYPSLKAIPTSAKTMLSSSGTAPTAVQPRPSNTNIPETRRAVRLIHAAPRHSSPTKA